MEKVSKATDGMSGKKIKIGRKYISKRYLGEKAANLFCHVILIGIVFLIIYPFIDKLSTVFLSEADLLDKTVKYIPKEFSLNTLLNTLGVMDYWATLLRTVGFCGAVALIQTFMSTFVAYGFARYKFPLNKLLFGFVLTTLLIPPQVYTTPIYMLFAHKLSLLDTIWPIILLSLICLGFKNALYIFLMRQYFRGLPAEIEEAGMIDGSGHFGIFFRLMFPNAIPMMVTIFLFSFSWQFPAFYFPLQNF